MSQQRQKAVNTHGMVARLSTALSARACALLPSFGGSFGRCRRKEQLSMRVFRVSEELAALDGSKHTSVASSRARFAGPPATAAPPAVSSSRATSRRMICIVSRVSQMSWRRTNKPAMPCLVHLVLDQAFVRLLVQRLFGQLEVVLQQSPRLLQRQLAAAGAGVSELRALEANARRTGGGPSCTRSGA